MVLLVEVLHPNADSVEKSLSADMYIASLYVLNPLSGNPHSTTLQPLNGYENNTVERREPSPDPIFRSTVSETAALNYYIPGNPKS